MLNRMLNQFLRGGRTTPAARGRRRPAGGGFGAGRGRRGTGSQGANAGRMLQRFLRSR